jgi:hypothetical protein
MTSQQLVNQIQVVFFCKIFLGFEFSGTKIDDSLCEKIDDSCCENLLLLEE